jgi:hypothetical protein
VNSLNLEEVARAVSPEPNRITLHGHTFTEPVSFRLRLSPISAGIYAILAADRSYGTTEFQVIYFGQCDDFSRHVTRSHERYEDWLAEAGGIENLYVAYYPIPSLPEAQRRAMAGSLITHYQPVCNEKLARHFSFGALLGIGR